MTADQIIEEIKSTLVSVATRGVLTYLITYAPFLSLPLINPIAGLLIGWIIGIAVKETELGAYYVYVDNITAEEAAAFEVAVTQKNQAVSDADKAKAEQAIIDAARNLIQYTR